MASISIFLVINNKTPRHTAREGLQLIKYTCGKTERDEYRAAVLIHVYQLFHRLKKAPVSVPQKTLRNAIRFPFFRPLSGGEKKPSTKKIVYSVLRITIY